MLLNFESLLEKANDEYERLVLEERGYCLGGGLRSNQVKAVRRC